MKLLNWFCGVFIGAVVAFALGILFGGCGPAAESFHRQPVECQLTPGDLYQYACEDELYERCLTPAGDVKYDQCEYMGVICVAKCP